jgi:Flp pilus assembly protein TadG
VGEASGTGVRRGTRYKMKQNRMRDERAQGVVEFALIATILMMLFLGTVDYARFLYYGTAIRNAAQSGAQMEATGCTNRITCGRLHVASADDLSLQAAVCAPKPYVNLQPYPTSASWEFCAACVTSTYTCYRNDPCYPTSTSTNVCSSSMCTLDVCVCRKATTAGAVLQCPNSANPAHGDVVQVSVGYAFSPISPLMKSFFSTRSCYPGDNASSNQHTLCATAVGRVY